MKWLEYRIVGDKTMEFSDGRKEMKERLHPAISGYGSYNLTYTDLNIAKKELEQAKKDLEDWTAKHNANAIKDKKYGVIIHWTDLHLESREVSEWEEVK